MRPPRKVRPFVSLTTNIFVHIEGFRPCLSKPSYRAAKWALMVRRMHKERLKSPQKSPIPENQATWVILAIFAKTKTAILVILASHFRTRVDTPKKSSIQGHACINETELHPDLAEIRPNEPRNILYCRGFHHPRGRTTLVSTFVSGTGGPGRVVHKEKRSVYT